MSYRILATVRDQNIRIKKSGGPAKHIPDEVQAYTLLEFIAQYSHVETREISKITCYKGDKILLDFDYEEGKIKEKISDI